MINNKLDIDKCESFLKQESERLKNDYYFFESDIFKEIADDKEQEKRSRIVAQRFDEFQTNIRELFKIEDDKYHPLYGLILDTFKRETYYKSGINPQDVVNSVLDTFCLIGNLQTFSYLKKIDDDTVKWVK